MIIWQIDFRKFNDSHNKMFVVAKDIDSNGKSNRSNSIISFTKAKLQSGSYYFYLELIK